MRIGVMPICPCTGIPARTMASMAGTWLMLPSHFMTSAFASCTKRPAFSTACSGDLWKLQ